jgi:hypothetical protein
VSADIDISLLKYYYNNMCIKICANNAGYCIKIKWKRENPNEQGCT